MSRAGANACFDAMDDEMKESVFNRFREISLSFASVRDAFHQAIEDVVNDFLGTLTPEELADIEAADEPLAQCCKLYRQ